MKIHLGRSGLLGRSKIVLVLSLWCLPVHSNDAVQQRDLPDDKSDVQKRFTVFLEWVQQGIDEAGLSGKQPRMVDSFEVKNGSYGLSLFSKIDFRPNDVMFILPPSRWISDREYGNVTSNPVSAHGRLSYWLVKQRQAGQQSPWAAYIDLLPADGNMMLPYRWPSGSWSTYLEGSFFREYVEEKRRNRRKDYDALLESNTHVDVSSVISLQDYEWAHDIACSRAAGFEDSDKSSKVALWPLYDFALHGHSEGLQNMAATHEVHSGLVTITASRHIVKGDEIWNRYFDLGATTNYDTLENWGFASQLASLEKKEARVHIHSEDARSYASTGSKMDKEKLGTLRGANFSLSETSKNDEGKAFLSYLRYLANLGVGFVEQANCGGHMAPNCASCPQGNGATWCNGDCKWIDESCVWKDSLHTSSIRPSLDKTTWQTEVVAMRIGQTIMQDLLARYKQTLAEDEQLLAREISDPRVRFMILIRRDEKLVLSWWLRYLRESSGESLGQLTEL